jgi:hypothetical protein
MMNTVWLLQWSRPDGEGVEVHATLVSAVAAVKEYLTKRQLRELLEYGSCTAQDNDEEYWMLSEEPVLGAP